MKALISILFFYFLLAGTASAQRTFSGRILDAQTNEPLAFASIGIKGKRYGTVSNGEGDFTFRIPEGLDADTLMCSYIGYASYQKLVGELPEGESDLTIALESVSLTLDEVIITPREPEDYIRSAVAKISENYLDDTYQTTGYYGDYFKEDEQYLRQVELIFNMNAPKYTADTSQANKPQVKLLQGKIRKDLSEVQFWKEKRDKRVAKGKDEDTGVSISSVFDGPAEVIELDPIRDLEPFLQEENFRKYRYEIETPVVYQGKTLMVISFKPRGKVDYTKLGGKIYLDIGTDAIVAVEYTGKMVIPAVVKPLLALLGIGISNPEVSKIARFRQLGDRWVIDNVLVNASVRLTDKNLFSSNEHFVYSAEQIFVATDFKTSDVTPFAPSEIFDSEKDLEEQLPPYDASFWSRYNIVRPRKIAQ
ncbi:MAG: carboxypeptidase-like regulatory domain-containing protein [Bacteroidota bacterium]